MLLDKAGDKDTLACRCTTGTGSLGEISKAKKVMADIAYRAHSFPRWLYIEPYLGAKRLDKIQVRDVRLWINKLCVTCQCCAQGKVEIPLAFDGAIVVASMSSSWPTGTAPDVGCWRGPCRWSVAWPASRLTSPSPSLIGRIIAAWPSAALIGSYELLMSQIRRASGQEPTVVHGEVAEDREPVGGDDRDSPEQAGPDECWLSTGRAIVEQFSRSAR
ncbi:hypothetical protein ACWDRB_39170 [Nonomuraea sp. NPDC003707]